ncbi:MAG: hypothetical protein ABJE47_02525 [bacterium]
MKVRTRFIVVTALLPLAWAGACGSDKSTAPVTPVIPIVPPEVEALRSSLAPYVSLAMAKNAGYTEVSRGSPWAS